MLNEIDADIFWLRYREIQTLFNERDPSWFDETEEFFHWLENSPKVQIFGNLVGSSVMSSDFLQFAKSVGVDVETYLGKILEYDPLLNIERLYLRFSICQITDITGLGFNISSNQDAHRFRRLLKSAPVKRHYLYHYVRFRLSLARGEILRTTIQARKALSLLANGWCWRDLLNFLASQSNDSGNVKTETLRFESIVGGAAEILATNCINARPGLFGLPCRKGSIKRSNVLVGVGKDVSIISNSGETASFSKDGRLIRPFCTDLGVGFAGLKNELQAGQTIKDPCIVLTAYYGIKNYSHACLDQIPRLAFIDDDILDQYGQNIVIDIQAPKFTKDLLHLILPNANLIGVENTVLHSFEEACLTSVLSHPAHNLHERCAIFFNSVVARARCIAAGFNLPTDRIYIERPNGRRGVENSDRVKELLQSFGFTILRLEEMSVAEQVMAFATSRVVVASHGAGLGNLAFCSPGTHVVEVFQRRYGIPAFQILSQLQGLKYSALVDSRYTNEKSDPRFKFEDIVYPLDDLKLHLSMICT